MIKKSTFNLSFFLTEDQMTTLPFINNDSSSVPAMFSGIES